MSGMRTLLAGTLAAGTLMSRPGFSGSPGQPSKPSVTCTSYPIHGTGSFRDEVEVQVRVGNSTSAPVNYLADVVITLAAPAGPVRLSVTGLVSAGSSSTLSRKVLVAGKARGCKISRLSQS